MSAKYEFFKKSLLAASIARTTVLSTMIAILLAPLLLAAVATPPLSSYAQPANPFAGQTFPPAFMNRLAGAPSYVISITEGSNGQTSFSPAKASIPLGMTVVWFNNGLGEHSVTTISNASSAQALDSGVIASGGSFIYTFTEPGIYNYTDSMDPRAGGIIDVGDAIESGNNFNMHVGGENSLPFDPQKPDNSFVLRFIPTTVTIPPTIAVTYNVTIAGSSGTLFKNQYTDSDGIFDLELLSSTTPSSANNTANANATAVGAFTTWGPDFIGQEGFNSDGTFHIQGPILNQNTQYSVTITMVSKDDTPLNNITDTFVLMPKAQ